MLNWDCMERGPLDMDDQLGLAPVICADIVIMGLSVLLLGSQDGLENVRGASSMHDERFRGNFRHRK
jgi:hypothetical protein